MNYKIVADSGCDLNKELEQTLNINIVPLTIEIDSKRYSDDKNLDINQMLQEMKKSINAPKTSCPSPNDFIKAFKTEGDIFAVTLSSKLSGTYNSAMIAKDMVMNEIGNKFIHVFDSLSASVGETLVSLKIFDIAKRNYDRIQIVQKVNQYIKEMKTFFVLESLDNLVKSGRMSALTGKVASLLSIKPIMRGSDEGTIQKFETVRGTKKAFRRLVEIIGEQGEKLEEKILGIGHCNCIERAKKIKSEILERYNLKDIIIVDMAGISSVYANEGGIVICF